MAHQPLTAGARTHSRDRADARWPAAYTNYLAASNAVERLPRDGDVRELRLALLANFTIDPLLRCSAARGPAPARARRPTSRRSLDRPGKHDPASGLYAFDPNVSFFAQWLTPSPPRWPAGHHAARRGVGSRSIESCSTPSGVHGVRKHSPRRFSSNTFRCRLHHASGSSTRRASISTHRRRTIEPRVSSQDRARRTSYVVDYMRSSLRSRRCDGNRPRYWHVGRAPRSRRADPARQEYGVSCARFPARRRNAWSWTVQLPLGRHRR